MLRICTHCSEEKSIDKFVKQNGNYRYKCKECRNASLRTGKTNTGRFQKKDKSLHVLHRNNEKVIEWKEKVLKRDDFKCFKCGNQERLHVHHIIPWKTCYEKRIDVDNGQTLCIKCHLSLEHKGKKIPEELRDRWSKSRKNKRVCIKTEFKKGMIPWNKGTKGKMPIPWNKGLKKNGTN